MTAPVATPSSIPIIKPNPMRKDGAMAMSGLLAREKRTMKESSPKNNRGLMRKLVSSTGADRMKSPVAGMIVVRLAASTTTSAATTEIANPSRKMARLLPQSNKRQFCNVQDVQALWHVTKRQNVQCLCDRIRKRPYRVF